MKAGKLQRRWSEEQPSVYDKEKRLVRMDIIPETKTETTTNEDGKEEQTEVQGWSYYEVGIDRLMDYGHIKSQLIEAAYAQKDEFGLLMNAVRDITTAMSSAKTFADFKATVSSEDLQTFAEFTEYRKMCAEAAKTVMASY